MNELNPVIWQFVIWQVLIEKRHRSLSSYSLSEKFTRCLRSTLIKLVVSVASLACANNVSDLKHLVITATISGYCCEFMMFWIALHEAVVCKVR